MGGRRDDDCRNHVLRHWCAGSYRNYTAVTYRGKVAADGNRYKALGNSMAVPVMRWILSRIEFVDGMRAAA